MKLLHIDSSILGAHSASRQISHEVAERLRAEGGSVEVTHRDLAADPLPHLELGNLPSNHPLAANLSPEVRAAHGAEITRSEAALQEFLAADVVLIGAPMYNFTVPSQLKAWIDRILIAGQTFSYGPQGPQGLIKGKRVIAVVARGGFYGQGSPFAAFEHLESYLSAVFGFIGVTDISFIVAEGLGAGPDARASAVERATAAARELRAA